MSETHHGSCLCGSVRIKISGRLGEVMACHCSQCQKMSGSYFMAALCLRANFAIEDPGKHKRVFQASARAKRHFCGNCGSSLFWEAIGAPTVSVCVGILEDTSMIALTAHIFTADKSAFLPLGDGLPQFPHRPDQACIEQRHQSCLD